MSKMNPNPTDVATAIDGLRAKVDVASMTMEPFWIHLKKSALTNEQMRTFFGNYHSIVVTSYRMLAQGMVDTPASDVDTLEALARFLASESAGHPNHLAYYIRWAEAFGAGDDLVNYPKNRAARAFEEALMGFYGSGDAMVLRAAQLAVEDSAEVLIQGLDAGFRKYEMPARAYGYLAAHLLLENDEDGHSNWAREELMAYPDTMARFGVVERTYRDVHQAFRDVFQGIHEDWRI